MIEGIISAVTIPVMAKVRIGHFVEAQILQSWAWTTRRVGGADSGDTPITSTMEVHRAFVCGATNLVKRLRRIGEGAAMIRSKGEAAPVMFQCHQPHAGDQRRDPPADVAVAGRIVCGGKGFAGAYELVAEVARSGKLPVTMFTAGGSPPADAAMMMQLGAEGVFVGSGIFKSAPRAPRRRDRQSHHLLRRPRRAGQGVARAGRGDGRHQRRTDRQPHRLASAAGKNLPWRSKRSSTRATLRSHLSRQRLQSGVRFSAAHVRRPCRGQSLVSAVRTVDPSYRVHSLHGILSSAWRCQGAHRFFWSAHSRWRIVRHQAGHCLQHGEIIFSMGASFQTHQQGISHQDQMPAAPPPDDLPGLRLGAGVRRCGFRQFEEWDVRIVPREQLQCLPARLPSSRCGFATTIRCPTIRCCTSARSPT
ncbi:SOR/SNZ family protein [Mycobacterium kansasii]|uniref:pyridoxal 5'-phosphate synthase (glutamine hydrolyzing) n=1 Tax=Mycobacterium kansasii TaxID=1768 RepID=A0A1V3W974_MYCKA|nr:SOR/SNZ family protein [Mycobacterium kansasii]